MSDKAIPLSERMEEVQGPASYWITDVEKLEQALREISLELDKCGEWDHKGNPINQVALFFDSGMSEETTQILKNLA